MDALKGLFPSIYSCRDALHPSSSSDVEELVESMRETQRSIGMVPKGVFQADPELVAISGASHLEVPKLFLSSMKGTICREYPAQYTWLLK